MLSSLSLALDRLGRPNVNKTNSGKLGETQREQCRVGREQREPKSEGKTRWWTHASGCITTLTTTTTAATVNVVAMTNFWAQWPILLLLLLLLLLVSFVLQIYCKEEATKWKWKWRMNEWTLTERELLTLKLAGKVCAYLFVFLVVYWLEEPTVRLEAITTTMAKSVTRCMAVNWIAPLRLCVWASVCVRVLTKKCVNKWDAKQNEFL